MSESEIILNMAKTIVNMYLAVDADRQVMTPREIAFCEHFYPQFNQASRIVREEKMTA